MAYRLRHGLTASSRASSANTARIHRRLASLYGTGTNWEDEPIHRFQKRPLFAGRYLLRNVDGRPAVHGLRSDGMGSLPHRQDTDTATQASGESARRAFRT